jgi:hypothetical protein
MVGKNGHWLETGFEEIIGPVPERDFWLGILLRVGGARFSGKNI